MFTVYARAEAQCGRQRDSAEIAELENVRPVYATSTVTCNKETMYSSAHRRKSRGGHGGHVPRENWTAGDGVALCPPNLVM